MTKPMTSLVLVVLVSQCRGKQEEAIPVSDVGEGNLCDQDQSVARICLACSSLPFNRDVNLVTCCSTDPVYQFCKACVQDQDSCSQLVEEMEAFKKSSESEEDYYDEVDGSYGDLYDDSEPYDDDQARRKRYGTLFLTSPKRYGRLLFGKRVPEKRYGRLYMGSGSYFGKRSSVEYPQYEYDQVSNLYDGDVNKRFGYVLGSSYKLGKREDETTGDEFLPEKRYGQLFLGKSKWFGKRNMDKRFGRLFFGRKGMFGKRYAPDDDSFDVAKRYGRLFMGRRRGTLFG